MAPASVSNYNNDSTDVIGILGICPHKLQGDTFYFVKKKLLLLILGLNCNI